MKIKKYWTIKTKSRVEMKATENGVTRGTENGLDVRKIDIAAGIEKGDERIEKLHPIARIVNTTVMMIEIETVKNAIGTPTETAKTTDGIEIEIVTAIETGATTGAMTGAIRIVTAIKTSEIIGIVTATKTIESTEIAEAKIEETKAGVIVTVTVIVIGTGTTIEEVLRAGVT